MYTLENQKKILELNPWNGSFIDMVGRLIVALLDLASPRLLLNPVAES
jgi:hypothetical protein